MSSLSSMTRMSPMRVRTLIAKPKPREAHCHSRCRDANLRTMMLTSPRREAVRARLVAAGGALAASLLVSAAALALLLGSRRRDVRDVGRAASDLATSSARLILQETG